jgi:hypothetical protein
VGLGRFESFDTDQLNLYLEGFGSVDLPLTPTVYLRAEPSLAGYAYSSPYMEGSRLVIQSDRKLVLGMLRASIGFDLSELFTVRFGPVIGVSSASIDNTRVPPVMSADLFQPVCSGSVGGVFLGGMFVAAARFGPERRIEVGPQFDFTSEKLPYCTQPLSQSNTDGVTEAAGRSKGTMHLLVRGSYHF